MRTSTLLSILPFLAYTSARVIQRTRDHKEIMNNLSARGDYSAPEHDQDETLVKIINEPGSDAAQYLSYDGNSFTAFSTSTHGASALPTGFNFANKNLAQGDSPSKSQIDQVGAASYEADQPPEIDPAIAGGQGTVPQEEVDEWLRVHNIARGAHGAGPLEWSEELAKSAKSNAEQCKGEHTAEKGENIASNSKEMSPQVAVDQWMGNAKLYNGRFQESTAHYTQMVWKSTTYVGCYLQECAPGTRYDKKYGTSWQATCRYDVAGNNIAGTEFRDNTQA